MVTRLAEYLDVPLRDRNTLLLAAGFAPAFRERSVTELDAAKAAIDRVLAAHKPYPAFAVDRHWNVILSNGALPQLYEGCAPELLAEPINSVRLVLHPEGMGPRIVNYAEWRAHTVSVLRQQIEARADPNIHALLNEVMAYPAPAVSIAASDSEIGPRLAVPLQIATRLGIVSFLSTTTVFGTPHDVTLAELALEMLFPADDMTAQISKAMVRESAAAA